jgi:hypothetical protein|nr:MAG TPA: Protein of unknown function (DUF1642) [Caudoviricetes sp.]
MNIQGLIERYEKFKASKKKLTSVDLVLKDLRSLDEPEPLPFKLKDVVRRIRGFNPTTQTRWLNDILKELGDNYGSMKYREGYDQGKFEGEWVGNQLKDADKIRQELNKPVIPQFVADWIEKCKAKEKRLLTALLYTPEKVNSWLDNSENQELFARAWLDGYEEVEEEKRYIVKMKGLNEDNSYLNYDSVDDEWYFTDAENGPAVGTHHTRKQLEDADFGWVFDCPGVEVEEVK